jgi:2-C-methyl-D-erythritol 4-phosphate cytidylyltransferase
LKFALLMPAAGSGARLGADVPKALIEIAGKPLFVHAADLLVRHPDCNEAVIAAPAGYEAQFSRELERAWSGSKTIVVTGGRTRQESVFNAFRHVSAECEAVLIHDAARPFLTSGLINRVLAALAGDCVAVVAGLPVTDTIKWVEPESHVVVGTIERAKLVAVQTPQAILKATFEEALGRAALRRFEGTDDVSLVEHFRLGTVRVVAGDPGNFKVTTAEDLMRARDLLERNRRRTAQ